MELQMCNCKRKPHLTSMLSNLAIANNQPLSLICTKFFSNLCHPIVVS